MHRYNEKERKERRTGALMLHGSRHALSGCLIHLNNARRSKRTFDMCQKLLALYFEFRQRCHPINSKNERMRNSLRTICIDRYVNEGGEIGRSHSE